MSASTQAQIDAALQETLDELTRFEAHGIMVRMFNEELAKRGLTVTAAADVGEANKCKYPNCDGGPMSGYCHIECRADLVKREWSAGYCEGVAATIERCAQRAKEYMQSHQSFTHDELVAAIRALKEKP